MYKLNRKTYTQNNNNSAYLFKLKIWQKVKELLL